MENRRLKSALALAAMFITNLSMAQGDSDFLDDTFYRDGKYYVAVLIISLIFAAIVFYLVTLDRKIGRLEKDLKKNED